MGHHVVPPITPRPMPSHPAAMWAALLGTAMAKFHMVIGGHLYRYGMGRVRGMVWYGTVQVHERPGPFSNLNRH